MTRLSQMPQTDNADASDADLLAGVQFYLSHRLSRMIHEVQYQLLDLKNSSVLDTVDTIDQCNDKLRQMDQYRRDLIKPVELIRHLSHHFNPTTNRPYQIIADVIENDSFLADYICFSRANLGDRASLSAVLDPYLFEHFVEGITNWMVDQSSINSKLDVTFCHHRSAMVFCFSSLKPGTFHHLQQIETATDEHCQLLKSLIVLRAFNGRIQNPNPGNSLAETVTLEYPIQWSQQL